MNTVRSGREVSQKLWISLGVVACLLLLGWIILWMYAMSSFSLVDETDLMPHPTDQTLAAKFYKHRADFEHLRDLFNADKEVHRVYYESTVPEEPSTVGVNKERLALYQSYFTKLGLNSGVADDYVSKDIIRFIASTRGTMFGGSGKGYVYAESRPPEIVDDLNKYWSKRDKPFTVYKHLEGNWYLYFDYED